MIKKVLLGLALAGGLFFHPATATADPWDHARGDDWMRRHHDIAVDIEARPYLLQDRVYLERHRELRDWELENQPYVQYYTTNPYPIFEYRHLDRDHWHRYEDGHWGY